MGKRSTFPRRERDFYPTPLEAVQPLIPHLPPRATFIEPCAGNGALVSHMARFGYHCARAMDIEPQGIAIEKADALTDDGLHRWGADLIITNPPWSRPVLHQMIARFAFVLPTWLLFDADWMHTRQSAPYLPMLRKVVSVGRVKWIPDSKMTGKDNVAWYLFDACHSGPAEFIGRAA
ncbi:class I SAM-dependent methyltransferase [uncultured Paracoccus sp.]|uniref:class I SAM-dependent methyltransferase n=1 Tax=uncultured Paracoccus sp. TaxID=189685 RepID=UPI0025991E60|nr:class I SAM-dependent methyltransferase [uncultured Paracoccus sp.]